MFAAIVFSVAMLAAVVVWFALEGWGERGAARRASSGVPHGTLMATASGERVMVWSPPWWDLRAWAWYVFVRRRSVVDGRVEITQLVGGTVKQLNLRVIGYIDENAKRGAAPFWHWKRPRGRRGE